MKLYQDYTKERYLLSVNDTTLSSDNSFRFRKNLLENDVTEKVKIIDNKTDQKKAQYNLDQQTTKISALPSGNVAKYEFLTGKNVLSEKYLLEKAAAMKRFEYLPLGKKLKEQTDIPKKQYQGLDKTYEFDEKKDDKKPALK